MDLTSKDYLIAGLFFVAILDTITTITGITEILGDGGIQFFIAIVLGMIITTFLIYTFPIIYHYTENLLFLAAKILWLLALLYDLFTSFIGVKDILIESNSEFGFSQILITIGLTIFVSSCPIFISYIFYYDDNKRNLYDDNFD
jgi:hypothetical protein